MTGPSNNPPRKHHYVPVFYLKQWAGEDGRVCQYRKVYKGKVSVNRKHPDATGYKIDLYKIDALTAIDAQAVETQFMQLVDGRAFQALDLIKNDSVSTLSVELRSAWTRFLNSMKFRNPEAIAEIKSHIILLWQEGVAALEEVYAEERSDGDPATFADTVHPAAPHISYATFIRGMIDNERIGQRIIEMHWGVIFLAQAEHTLLTSDRPVARPMGLDDDNAYLALPIGPRQLFIAARNRALFSEIAARKHSDMVRLINYDTIRQAREFVWGLSDAQHTFVQRNISQIVEPPLLTDQARQEGIARAVGESADILRARLAAARH